MLHIFDLALQWHNEFPAEKFLGKHLILPGKEYFVEDIHWAIKDELYGKIPAIDCDHSNETLKPTILSKITLCFNLKQALDGHWQKSELRKSRWHPSITIGGLSSFKPADLWLKSNQELKISVVYINAKNEKHKFGT